MALFIVFTKKRTKCEACGKFISDKAMESGEAKYTFVPDTPFSCEKDLYHCPDCSRKYGRPDIPRENLFPWM